MWDAIFRTEYWDVAHAPDSALSGWLVLILRRHVESLDALSTPEAQEMGLLLRDVSHTLMSVVGCEKTYAAQFAEEPGFQHVHVHVVPRMGDLPLDRRGARIVSYLGVPVERRVSPARMEQVAAEVRRHLSKLRESCGPG